MNKTDNTFLRYSFIYILLFTYFTSFSQIKNFGTPYIINFTPEKYKADTKTWAIVQDTSGIMYFANHFGLLEFDGVYWRLVAHPNNQTFVRSLKLDKMGQLFIGCQNEFGYIKKYYNGQIEYFSLKDSIPEEYRDFGDVWQIFPTSKAIYFFTTKALYKYDYHKIEVIKPKSRFTNAFLINDTFFLFDKEYGLQLLDNDKIECVPKGDFFKNTFISALFKFDDNSFLICTDKHGLYLYNFKSISKFSTSADSFFKSNIISTGEIISDNYFAFGTINNGILIIDKTGKPISHLNTENGLQNNTIISIFKDKLNNLWVTTGYGIDYVIISSPFSYFGNESKLSGEIYQASVFNNKLYVATLQGVRYINWKDYYNPLTSPIQFKEIQKPKNVIRKIQKIGKELFVLHHNGIGIIKNNRYFELNNDVGSWTCMELKNSPDKMIVGTYNGFQLFKKNQKSEWQYAKDIKGFNLSSRIIAQDSSGNIWMAHGYHGIYKITLNAQDDSVIHYKLYNSNNGFPSDLFINLFKIKGELVFGTVKGTYKYNPVNDSMEPYSFYNKYLGSNFHIRYLKEDKNGNIWYIKGKDGIDATGILKTTKSGNIVNETVPFQVLKSKHIPGFENINFYKNHVFMGTKNGLIDYDVTLNHNYNINYMALIHQVILTKSDSMLYGNRTYYPAETKYRTMSDSTHKFVVPASQNDLLFSYASTFYEFPNKTLYSTYLEGYDDGWSEWNSKSEKQYTNLSGGKYVFKVKAKNIYDVESKVKTFVFQIKKPWYRTMLAYAIYYLLIAVIIYGLILIKNKRFKIEKRKLHMEELQKQRALISENRRNTLESENKIYKLEQEKLQERLSSFTMSMVKKNELFKSIRQRIEKLIYISKPEVSHQLKNVLKEIEQELEKGDQWKEFEIHFNKTHQDFLTKMQQNYPELTTKDLKFCAYIRMNLSSKEIVTLLNITIRGVEAARLRLRKKLDLSPETNLDDFILKF